MKKLLSLALAGMMIIGNGTVMAQEPVQTTEKVKEEGAVSIHQVAYRTPISLAELMYVIVGSTGEELPPIMDTHYAMPAMLKAEEMGIIDLDHYPMDMWLTPLTEEAFNMFLTQAMQSEKVDMGSVYKVINDVMINQVTVNGQPVNLEGAPIRHYKGTVMVPLRPVAEAMGFTVTWDKDTYTATLSNGKIKSPVQVGYDHYFYTSEVAIGMTAPMQLGVAPQLVDGTIYVPYNYFELFATIEMADGTIAYTMK